MPRGKSHMHVVIACTHGCTYVSRRRVPLLFTPTLGRHLGVCGFGGFLVEWQRAELMRSDALLYSLRTAIDWVPSSG